jgi:hypothetical protein
MPRLSADPIVMTVPHEQVLTRLVRAHTTPQKLVEPARMIFGSDLWLRNAAGVVLHLKGRRRAWH